MNSNVIKFKKKDPYAPYDLESARALPTEELKRLWDEDDDNGLVVSVEAIHYVLNERGHGDYCAV